MGQEYRLTGRVICLLGDKFVYLMTMDLILLFICLFCHPGCCLHICYVPGCPKPVRLQSSHSPQGRGRKDFFFSVQLLTNVSSTSLSLKRIWWASLGCNLCRGLATLGFNLPLASVFTTVLSDYNGPRCQQFLGRPVTLCSWPGVGLPLSTCRPPFYGTSPF